MDKTTTIQACDDRLGGLRRFAIAITVLNIVGHSWLGFEQSYAQPLVALAAAYFTEFILECVEASALSRSPRFMGGWQRTIDFFLSAHISGLACSMLIYANDRLWPVAFAAVAAISSKAIFRIPVGNTSIHFMNPSNCGIVVTLLLFPWVGIAQPYQFTENLSGVGDWILPGIIICTGSFINFRFTHRLPLIGAWLVGFFAQAVIRHLWYGTPLATKLIPMTGVVFVLYTFYMITDPVTTPSRPRYQILFGAAVALTYMLLVNFHIVFGFYFALAIVTAFRGLVLLMLPAFIQLQQRLVTSCSRKRDARPLSQIPTGAVQYSEAGEPATLTPPLSPL